MKHLKDEESFLVNENCVSCDVATPLAPDEIGELSELLEGGWNVVDGHHLSRTYRFPAFQEALDFANRVGEIAEEEEHHPTITVGWGMAEVVIFTRTINGLSRNDFILASKISQIVRQAYERHSYEATD